MQRGRPTKRQSLIHDEHRQKIETTKLAKRLTAHALGEAKMEPSQVTAALGLLKKTLPDLAAVQVDHSGEINVIGAVLSELDGTTRGLNGYGSTEGEAEEPTLQ